jgi:hypothetical protein
MLQAIDESSQSSGVLYAKVRKEWLRVLKRLKI